MLAERLNEVALDLHSFATHNSLVTLLQKVGTSLNQLRNTQQGASNQDQRNKIRAQLRQHLANLYSTLRSDPSNEFTPSRIKILKQIQGWEVTGNRLRERIEEILQAPALEAAQVMEEMEHLSQEVQAFYEGLSTLISAFDGFKVGRYTLPSGERAEVGISHPNSIGGATLADLYEEMRQWDEHLQWFAQAAGETPGRARVRAIGSSGWEIFLDTPLAHAAVVAIVVERVLQMLNHVADLKLKWDSLRSAGSTQEITDEMIEEDARNYLNERIEELVEDLLENYPGDTGRANEIRMPLRDAVDFIVERTREGRTVEVRVIPPADEEDDEEVAPGLGNLRDMQRRGRSMAGDGGDGLQLPRDTVSLLRAAAESEEPERDAGDEEETPDDDGAEETNDEVEPQQEAGGDEYTHETEEPNDRER